VEFHPLNRTKRRRSINGREKKKKRFFSTGFLGEEKKKKKPKKKEKTSQFSLEGKGGSRAGNYPRGKGADVFV